MIIFWLVLLILLLGLQFTVIRRGAPYVPTLSKQRRQALDLLDLQPGQTLIDLGAGDGAMLIAAAARGINAVGYEINPLLVIIAKIRTAKYRHNVTVIWGNFWKKHWPPAEGVFVFLTGNYMNQLEIEMKTRFNRPVKLVTYGFSLNTKKPFKKSGALFLYKYP